MNTDGGCRGPELSRPTEERGWAQTLTVLESTKDSISTRVMCRSIDASRALYQDAGVQDASPNANLVGLGIPWVLDAEFGSMWTNRHIDVEMHCASLINLVCEFISGVVSPKHGHVPWRW